MSMHWLGDKDTHAQCLQPQRQRPTDQPINTALAIIKFIHKPKHCTATEVTRQC